MNSWSARQADMVRLFRRRFLALAAAGAPLLLARPSAALPVDAPPRRRKPPLCGCCLDLPPMADGMTPAPLRGPVPIPRGLFGKGKLAGVIATQASLF